ncbi:hypothetical protein [Glutamicibacter sp.]|uniref:hypothetical protein n=1 Tax=Glutamicibacter sp. TaxID=1931995 RepID=UPI002FE28582
MNEGIDVPGEATLSPKRLRTFKALTDIRRIPSLGNFVYYQPANRPTPLVAIIVDVDDEFVNLTVFQPDGTTKPMKNVVQAEHLTEYCWSWTKN